MPGAFRELFRKPSIKLKNNTQPAVCATIGVILFCLILYKGRNIKLNRWHGSVIGLNVWMNDVIVGQQLSITNSSSIVQYPHVENSSCHEYFSPYICSDLVPELKTGMKRETGVNPVLSP